MEQKICDLIQRRRLQLLVHSCIYYEMDRNIIPDKTWDKWARELVELQSKYPEESESVIWYDAFKDWDASTGAFLPLKDTWVVSKAKYLLKICGNGYVDAEPKPQPVQKQKMVTTKKKKSSKLKKLF